MLNYEFFLDFRGCLGVIVLFVFIVLFYRIGYCCKYKEDYD